MIQVFTPETPEPDKQLRVFLAGTIDNGDSENWQNEFIKRYAELAESPNKTVADNVVIYNPRRANWNPNPTKEDMEYQINWELEKMESADVIIMNILPNSKSPISLLELGLHSRLNKLIVICSEDFYRYDNVRVTCGAYNIPLYKNMDELFRTWTKL